MRAHSGSRTAGIHKYTRTPISAPLLIKTADQTGIRGVTACP
jgi:hypothetical protein